MAIRLADRRDGSIPVSGTAHVYIYKVPSSTEKLLRVSLKFTCIAKVVSMYTTALCVGTTIGCVPQPNLSTSVQLCTCKDSNVW